MTKQKSIYRKNFSLIIAFIVLLSAILVVALLITYNLTRKYVTNEFSSRKIEVLEQTITRSLGLRAVRKSFVYAQRAING